MAEPQDINSETLQVKSETIQVFKGFAKSLDINSETMQAVEAVDWPSNGKDAIEKKDLNISKQGKPTNHSIERIRKKVGAPLVGSKKGNPKIEWDSMDGEKYIKTITCQVCGKLFHHEKYVRGENLAVSYRNHYRQHELETTDCGCDNIQFKSFLERNRHWKIVHGGHVLCKICKRTFLSESGCKLHIENAHQEQKCDQCDYKTSIGNYHLKLHKRNVHENKEENNSTSYTCNQDDCEKTFITKVLLNRHVNGAHRILSTCHFCQKQVKQLDEHIRTIHSENKYQCDKCAKAFKVMAKLVQHEKVEHQGFRYFCRYSDCKTKDQEYRDSSNRSAHERKRHGAPFNSCPL